MNKPRIVDLPSYSDDRGTLVPVFNNYDHDDAEPYDIEGIAGSDLRDVKRSYFISNSQKNVVRGFHYHKHETKYFTVIKGMAKFVSVALAPDEVFNIRQLGKDIFKDERMINTFYLSERNPQMVIIPPQNANGWMSLTDDCILLAHSSSTFEQSKNDDHRIDPYEYGDIWSVKAR